MRKLCAAALAAGLIASNVPSAHAAPTAFGCRLVAVKNATLIGGADTFTGIAVGYSVESPQAWIRCYVTVDGSEHDTTPLGAGPNVATTWGQVTWSASDFQSVKLCATWRPGPSENVCEDVTITTFPPDEVVDNLKGILSIVDPIVCSILMGLSPGVPGIADIDSDGDLAVLGLPIYDCPPYGDADDVFDVATMTLATATVSRP